MRLWFRTLYSMTLHGLKWWSRLVMSELLVISTVLLLVQVDIVLSKLPLVSVHWKLKLQSGTIDPQLPGMAPATPRERSWVDVPVGEECVVQIEVVRRCLRGKVLQSLLLEEATSMFPGYVVRVHCDHVIFHPPSLTFTFLESESWESSYLHWFLKGPREFSICCRRWYSYVALCPARARLPARNGLVNEVEFLGLITQNG